MPETERQKQAVSQQSSGADVLKGLNALYHTSLSESAFWASFTRLLSQLCKSPCLMVISGDQQGQWHRVEAHFENEELKEGESALIEQSLDLLPKLQGREFVSGPYHLESSIEIEEPYLFCSKLKSDRADQNLILIAIVEHNDVLKFNEYLVRFQLNQSTYFAHRQYLNSESQDSSVVDEEVLYALKLSDLIVGQDKFLLSAMTLVNELCDHYGCSRVSLGWKGSPYFKAIAISHLEKFDHNSPEVAELRKLFEETSDHDQMMIQPTLLESDAIVRIQHERHQRQRSLQQLVSIPLHRNGECLAVVCLEFESKTLSKKDMHLAHVALAQVLPWMHHLQKKDRWPHQKFWSALHAHGLWWLGPRHTLVKLIAIACFTIILSASLIKSLYRIEATASLETDHIAYLSAPFNGFIKEVHSHSGEQVSKNQVLMTMDREELQLRALEEEANVNRFQRESEKARSGRNLVDMKIALARVDQAKAELKRIEYYLGQAEVRTPFSGIVVEGEKQELLGAPVSKGDLLIKVVHPADLHLKIKVNEEDIDELREGGVGELTLLSQPGKYHPIIIQRIIPMAKAENQEGNVFTVIAKLKSEDEDWWRPGMSGVVKLDVEERSWLWIALHRSWDSLRLLFWF